MPLYSITSAARLRPCRAAFLWPSTERWTVACPYIDADNQDCQRHMCLEHLSEAIAICGHEYQSCPIYQRLQAEQLPQLAAQAG